MKIKKWDPDLVLLKASIGFWVGVAAVTTALVVLGMALFR